MEEFLELANRVSWHDAALGACFQLGLDDETIRCDLPVSDFPLIELINLVLYLNCSYFEVEEIEARSKSRRPTPSGTRCVSPAHLPPGTPTYRANSSDHLRNPQHSRVIRSSTIVLSPEMLATSMSRLPAALKSSPTSRSALGLGIVQKCSIPIP